MRSFCFFSGRSDLPEIKILSVWHFLSGGVSYSWFSFFWEKGAKNDRNNKKRNLALYYFCRKRWRVCHFLPKRYLECSEGSVHRKTGCIIFSWGYPSQRMGTGTWKTRRTYFCDKKSKGFFQTIHTKRIVIQRAGCFPALFYYHSIAHFLTLAQNTRNVPWLFLAFWYDNYHLLVSHECVFFICVIAELTRVIEKIY